MSQTLGETMMASFMASTKEIPDIFILVVVEGFTPLGLHRWPHPGGRPGGLPVASHLRFIPSPEFA